MSDFFVSRLGWVNAAVTGNPDGAASVLIDVIDIISSQSISRGIMYEILRWVREVFDWGTDPFIARQSSLPQGWGFRRSWLF